MEPVGATGLALGLFCVSEYESVTLTLSPGDLLVFYSDGLCEARGPGGDEYGVERLTARLERLAAAGERDPARVTAACLEDLATFRAGVALGDDLTVMVVRRA